MHVRYISIFVVIALYYGLYRLARKAGDEMEARGENGTPYSLMVFFMPLIGIPYWLIRRREGHAS